MATDWLYKVALTKIPGVGPVTAKNLISYCGGVEAIFQSSARQLRKVPGLSAAAQEALRHEVVFREAEKELRFLEREGIRPLFYLDPEYPQRLLYQTHSPVILYYRGTADLNARRIVSIVGTRRPSPYGKAACEELVAQLKPYDPLIVSGLAYGIDVTAHRKALNCGLDTVGVLAHGLDSLYPPAHRGISQQMLGQGGLLTEYGIDTQPDREHFPTRNRIVAGMCDALIVVETAEQGGSMITATFAREFKKEVFAVPGRIQDAASMGCHKLLKERKARLLDRIEDLADVFRWKLQASDGAAVQGQLFHELSEREQALVRLLQEKASLSADQLAPALGVFPGELATLLLELEFKGLIRTLPGQRYMLVGHV